MRSEKKFNEMADMLPQIIYEADLKGNLKYVNKIGFELFGYTKEDFDQGVNILSVIYENDRPKALLNLKKILDGGKPENNQYTAQRKDGSLIPIQIYTSLIVENDEVKGFRGIIIDITERKIQEEQYKRNENRLQKAQSLVKLGYSEQILNSNLVWASAEAKRVYGFDATDGYVTLEQIAACTVDKEAFKKAYLEMIQKGNKFDLEYVINPADGSPQRYIHAISELQVMDDGNTKMIVSSFLDITERKIAEKALKESELKYRSLFENAQLGIYQITPEGKILSANPSLFAMLGCKSTAEIERILSISNSKHGHFSDPVFLRRIKEKGYIHDFESTWNIGKGEVIIVMENIRIVRDHNDIPLYYESFVENITEKKKNELELEHYRDHLEFLVNDRTHELAATNEELTAINEELHIKRNELEIALKHLKETQNQLIQSEKMASLGILAAGVAHEINNPLNFIVAGITGVENYIAEHFKDHASEIAPLINGIQVGVKRASDIVTSLNHYSRQNDKISTDCNIHTIIDNCLVMLNNQIKNRIEIIKTYTQESCSVFCNEGKIHQAFLNILANSVQAIEKNGTIEISTEIIGNRINISITDTGIGISNDILHRITDPFFTTKEPGKGTGLGLSITYNILNEYNGTLNFESQPELGTRVIISLPVNVTNSSML